MVIAKDIALPYSNYLEKMFREEGKSGHMQRDDLALCKWPWALFYTPYSTPYSTPLTNQQTESDHHQDQARHPPTRPDPTRPATNPPPVISYPPARLPDQSQTSPWRSRRFSWSVVGAAMTCVVARPYRNPDLHPRWPRQQRRSMRWLIPPAILASILVSRGSQL